MSKIRLRKSPFSMIELLIVMSVIVLLAGILMTGTIYARRNARSKRALSQVDMIRLALTEYQAEYGHYPSQPVAAPLKRALVEGLADPTGRPFLDLTEEAFSDSVGKDDMTDAFGNAIFYQSPGTMNKKTFDLWSKGPDGKHGLGGTSPSDAQKASENTDDINTWTRR